MRLQRVSCVAALLAVCACTGEPMMQMMKTEICDNGQDDNGDGKTDCADPECFANAACAPTAERCDNHLDDDLNGLTDCADPACFGKSCGLGCTCSADGGTGGGSGAGGGSAAAGGGTATGGGSAAAGGGTATGGGTAAAGGGSGTGGGAVGETQCSNGLDDDGDHAIDCGDSDCVGNAACMNLQDGNPCVQDAQCAGGLCRTEAGWGDPQGSCSNSAACTANTQVGCHGGVCLYGGAGSCMAPCTGTGLAGAGRCRVGFVCLDPDSTAGNNNNLCVVLCAADSDCSGSGAGYGCNPFSHQCGLKDKGLLQYGAACSSYNECESGSCFGDASSPSPNWPNGYCAGSCRGDLKACGTGGYCTFDTTRGDNLGFCVESCSTVGMVCRPESAFDYTCLDDARAPGVGQYCACKTTGEPCTTSRSCCSGSCSTTCS